MGVTSTFLKQRKSTPGLGQWSSGFTKTKNFAVQKGAPLIAVWTNGDACSHCVTLEKALITSYFKNWAKNSGMVFYAVSSAEAEGAIAGKVFHWCRKDTNTAYPFVRIYWPAGKVDIATIGDTVDGNKTDTAGAKKAVAYFKSKLKKYNPDPEPAPPTPDPDPPAPDEPDKPDNPEPDDPPDDPEITLPEDDKKLKLGENKTVKTFAAGQAIQFDLPASSRTWVVQVSNNVKSVQVAGGDGDTGSQLRDVPAFGDELSCLGEKCFTQCDRLGRVYLSPQIRRIDRQCFEGCAGLSAVSYGAYETTVADADEAPALEHVGARAFADCGNVRALVLPESISSLDQLDPEALAGSNVASLTLLGITAKQLSGG